MKHPKSLITAYVLIEFMGLGKKSMRIILTRGHKCVLQPACCYLHGLFAFGLQEILALPLQASPDTSWNFTSQPDPLLTLSTTDKTPSRVPGESHTSSAEMLTTCTVGEGGKS
nr:PREDICTED: uncharacterized protein LOC107076770 isoform X2 [Lepisosteus oculatus]